MSINYHDGKLSICRAHSNREWPDPSQSETKSSSVSSHLHVLGWQITFYLPPTRGTHTRGRDACGEIWLIFARPLYFCFSSASQSGGERASPLSLMISTPRCEWRLRVFRPQSVRSIRLFSPLRCGRKYPAFWTGPSSQYRKMRWWVMFLLLCIDKVVVGAAVSFRGSSMIITQYGALSMHCSGELCKPSVVDGRTVNVSRWFDHQSLLAGCFQSGIHRDKKRKTNVKMHTEEQQDTLFWTEHMHTSLHPRDYVCRSKPSWILGLMQTHSITRPVADQRRDFRLPVLIWVTEL